MRRRVQAGVGGLAAIVLAAMVAACGGGSSSTGAAGESGAGTAGGKELTLTIGFSGALSGPYAAYDQPLLNGMEMAAKQIEAAGGYKGVHIKIVSKDNKDDQTLTATTTQELLDQGIKVFVLSTADVVTAEGLLVAQSGGISSVGANTAGQIVKDVGPSTFMIVAPDTRRSAPVGSTTTSAARSRSVIPGSVPAINAPRPASLIAAPIRSQSISSCDLIIRRRVYRAPSGVSLKNPCSCR